MSRLNRLSAALALAVAAWPASRAEESRPEVQLRTVTVTATRTDAAAEDVPATITTIERSAIERRQPADDADLFRDEPGVVLPRDLRRFGATRVNIRGIEDNRVTQMVDGVRISDFYNGGGPTNFTMNAPLGTSIDFLKRVEILRGPASSLYGSDAIGGVVGYLTLDPSDLLGAGKDQAFRYRFGINGANDGRTHALLGAWRFGTAEALLGYTRTDAHEFDNQGDVDTVSPLRTRPNPQDVQDQGVLAKLLLRPAAGHRFGFTLEGRQQEADVDVLRLSTALPKVAAMRGNDASRRARGSVDWEHQPAGAFYDRMKAQLYAQRARSANFNQQERLNTSATCSAAAGRGNNCLVDQEFTFMQSGVGGTVQFESALRAGGLDHVLTYGADVSRVKTEEFRDALARNVTTGSAAKSLAGDVFPLRDFPNGRTDTVGVFVQDEIAGLAGGRLLLTPGLRFDWRQLQPELDPLSQGVLSSIGRSAVSKTASSLSPKLGALWRASEVHSFYGQVVRGFRAPNYDEVNGAFRNLVQGYAISPNPDLEPETSIGVEAGVKLHAPRWNGQFALFDTRYRNFIERIALPCPGDPRCVAGVNTTFMNVNQARARIFGAEARAAWDLQPGWRLDGAVAFARGDNRSTGQPLNSVEPARLSVGLLHDAGVWGAEARLRAARAVTRTDDSGGAFFRPPGYGVTDLSFWWRPTKSLQLILGISNLFDQKYWQWGDIRQADAPNPQGVDFYSQSGRKLALSMRVDL